MTRPPSSKRLQQEVAGVEGITLYMQPVQDLTVEDRSQPHAISVQPGRRRSERNWESGRPSCSTS